LTAANIFYFKIDFAVRFAVPSTLLPGRPPHSPHYRRSWSYDNVF